MAHEYRNLGIPSLEWLGLQLTDLQDFTWKTRKDIVSTLNEPDIRIAGSLMKKLSILREYSLVNQVNNFIIYFNSLYGDW